MSAIRRGAVAAAAINNAATAPARTRLLARACAVAERLYAPSRPSSRSSPAAADTSCSVSAFSSALRKRRDQWHRIAMTAVSEATRQLSRAGAATRVPRVRVAVAAAGVAFSLENLRAQLGMPRVTPATCATSCDALLSSVVTTPFKSYTRERLYTVELDAPFAGAPVAVLTHGYGSGSGLWCFNIDDLARTHKLYLVDWLGCGASERPPWTARSVADGEAFFVESLDAWRRAVGLGDTPFALVGHSLGGYLSAAYAMAHPDAVSHLVLVSPAGVPAPPDAVAVEEDVRMSSWAMSLLRSGWEAGVTPQAVVRSMGPFSERLASRLITARFRKMLAARGNDGADPAAFVRYLYHITVADGSGAAGHVRLLVGRRGAVVPLRDSRAGWTHDTITCSEHALRVLLSFGAHARHAIGPRLVRAAAGLEDEAVEGGAVAVAVAAGSAPRPATRRTFRGPVTFLYGGSHDWMPATAGYETAARLRSLGVDAACLLTPGAGHHLYMENPDAFAAQVVGRLRRK